MKLVTVIVATRNEALNIENCLKSLKDQKNVSLEIIVVDNNSHDGTRDIAKKYTDKVFNLANEINLKEVTNFRGAQVNFGATRASGEVVFFPDADMTFDEGLLEECLVMLEEIDALYIPEVICGKGFFGKVRNFERSFYNGTCIDALRVVKKSYFDKAGGFDTKNIVFGPDDWDLTKTLRKTGVRTGITTSTIYHHEERLDMSTYLEKKGKYAPTLGGYIEKWGPLDEDVLKQLGLWYRYFGVFLESGKWKVLLSHPVKMVAMYGIRFWVGVKYINYKMSN